MEIHSQITRIHSDIFGDELEIYLVHGDQIALIDTGTPSTPKEDIEPVLADLGLSLNDIDLILNTHGHPDHIGGNAFMKSKSDAQIMIHHKDAVYLENHELSFDLYFAPVFKAIQGEESLEEEKARFQEMSGQDLSVDRPLEDNDIIHLGKGCDLRVIHLPGHTKGSVGYLWEREGILFSGDSLPGLHTTSGGLPILYDFSSYGKSIDRLRDLSLNFILSSHFFRGVFLPPSPVRHGDETIIYIEDSFRAYEWLYQAAEKIKLHVSRKPFMEIADDFVAALPEGTGFMPVSRMPPPLFNVTTILSALGMFKE